MPRADDDAVTTTADDDKKPTFASLGLCKELVSACEELGWREPSAIQQKSIPEALQGRDVIGLAQTGSGKTGAFALPILQSLLDEPRTYHSLILSPTRELAIQIAEQVEALGRGIGVRTATLVGGIEMTSQAIMLGKRPHVVVGTPGRVVDHLENTKGFGLKALKVLVLDEADRLLNLDFEEEIDKILRVIPQDRRTQLFSATMTSKVQKLQRACLRDPVKVEVSAKYSTVDSLRQHYLFIPAKHKDCYATYLFNELSASTLIVFARTCDQTRKLALIARNLGFGAVPIHGQMSQPKRIAALQKFKAGERNILIATDVASRGLDIPSVDVVINYDVPQNSKDYVHRVGRTARAGRSGLAVTMVTQYDVELYQKIERLINKKLDKYPLEEEAVMLLYDRVNEAQRIAIQQMRDQDERKGKGAKRGFKDDDEADKILGMVSGKRRHDAGEKLRITKQSRFNGARGPPRR
ncbi:Helicase, C-terminal [Ostreococcus tauri]|uniref:Helicase, C-terminal n=1 Tax=Ostreococcus tauri TaxID=70448 RepID=A0A090N4F8_OSTTA|nr:Helicase, C-terminal [Ostreococcus tauri]CEF99793.1 Helicase, C-terminal [Ostreococcus tauri]|eukprot:XP_003082214.2 Helicase, C-terminal [Ostreococcus tauri]